MILHGNSKEKLKELETNSVDAIVTDPPYELGFMGKAWDNSGIAYDIELWSECLRVLKPGGHLLAFGGTRTYHRMTVAIEDAGFEIRDMIEWVYGSGFPKSLNIEKQLIKQGYIEEAKDWIGFGTATKPSHEPICMARKPLAEKTIALNCLKWGTGGINIDGSRVGTEGARFNGRNVDSDIYGKYGTDKPKEVYDYGRFPANLIHDNSEEVRECFPETKSGGISKNYKQESRFDVGEKGKGGNLDENNCFNDSGNASRFFKSILYHAKASKSERNKGCDDIKGNIHATVKPVALMEYLINMVSRPGDTILDPFAGSGTTGVACNNLGRKSILIEMMEEHIKIIEARMENKENKLF